MVRRYRANGVDYLAHADQHAAGGLDPVAGGGGGGGYVTVQDEGVGVTARTILNFKGTGVTAADNAGTGATDVTIPGGGGTPAASVVAETGYGQGTVVGVATNYAREDHSHGSPALGATAATAAAGNHSHTANPALATNAIVFGTAAAPGVAATTLRSDDTIAAFDATVPVTQAFGDAAAVGAVAFAARRDHKHGMPANPAPAFATPAIVLGTAAAAGAAATVIRSDATIIAAFDATVPTTLAFGGAAAVGTAAFAARRDHAHGMPSGWQQLASVSLGASATSLSSGVITARLTLMIEFYIPGYGGSDVLGLQFNADTASTSTAYQSSHLEISSAGAVSGVVTISTNRIRLAKTAAAVNREGVVFIRNVAAVNKTVHASTISNFGSAGAAVTADEVWGLWANTAAQITTVLLSTAGGQTMNAGTRMVIWGRDDT